MGYRFQLFVYVFALMAGGCGDSNKAQSAELDETAGTPSGSADESIVTTDVDDAEVESADAGTTAGPLGDDASMRDVQGAPCPELKGSDSILVFSSGSSELDNLLVEQLERHGNTVTLGPTYDNFDATADLGAYDVVYMQANINWDTPDMPLEAQATLKTWILCGGALLTVEWVMWKLSQGQLAELATVMPTEATGGYGEVEMITYVARDMDPVVHADLPPSFSFTADSFGGTEAELIALDEALVFFVNRDGIAAVVGTDAGKGRVANVSTTAGPAELTDDNYSRMLGNLVNWLQRDPSSAAPAP